MKIYVFVLLVVIVIAFALPTEDKMPLESLLENEDEFLKLTSVEEHHRQRRVTSVTCDLLSGLGVGHSLCAALCIHRGNKGGYCNETGTCVCRTE